MPVFAWAGAGAAALVAAALIMLGGGRGKRRPVTADLNNTSPGAATMGGDVGDDGEFPARRHLLPGPTQTETGPLQEPGQWGGYDGGPSVTYSSPGDGDGGTDATTTGAGWHEGAYNAPSVNLHPFSPPADVGSALTQYPAPSGPITSATLHPFTPSAPPSSGGGSNLVRST